MKRGAGVDEKGMRVGHREGEEGDRKDAVRRSDLDVSTIPKHEHGWWSQSGEMGTVICRPAFS